MRGMGGLDRRKLLPSLLAFVLCGQAAVGMVFAFEGEDDERVGAEEGEVAEEVPDLDLPEWGEADQKLIEQIGRPLNLGGGLWPEAQVPLEKASALVGPAAPPPVTRTVLKDPAPIPKEFVGAYFGDRPPRFLVDPQGLIDPVAGGSIDRFLDYHAKESVLEAFVLVMDRHHELPVGVSTAETWERWFPDRFGAIVLYHLGEPGHTAIEFGPWLVGQIGRERLQMLLDACVRDALETGDEAGQLDRFCVRFSVEIYWLENELGVRTVAAGGDRIRVGPGRQAAGEQSMTEVLVIALVAVLLGGTAAALLWGWNRRPMRLPVVTVEPRLGGTHSGGSDTVVGFGKDFRAPPRRPDAAP
ncbi:hypothetical protein BH23VER1_BH23VER1_20360 [soil metagenome]